MRTYKGKLQIECTTSKCALDLKNCVPSCADCVYGKVVVVGLADDPLMNLKQKPKPKTKTG